MQSEWREIEKDSCWISRDCMALSSLYPTVLLQRIPTFASPSIALHCNNHFPTVSSCRVVSGFTRPLRHKTELMKNQTFNFNSHGYQRMLSLDGFAVCISFSLDPFMLHDVIHGTWNRLKHICSGSHNGEAKPPVRQMRLRSRVFIVIYAFPLNRSDWSMSIHYICEHYRPTQREWYWWNTHTLTSLFRFAGIDGGGNSAVEMHLSQFSWMKIMSLIKCSPINGC